MGITPRITAKRYNYDPMHYPPGLRACDFAQAKSLIASALASPERLDLLSKAARQYAVRHLDGSCRAALLDAVCRDSLRARDLSDYEQSYIYKWLL